jgi:L-seryl-tRNA(Ser) seleniumtransferase
MSKAKTLVNRPGRIGRRSLLGASGLAAAGSLLHSTSGAAWAAALQEPETSSIYTSLGVRPLINCKGTFTIITGSLSLPEVKRAMLLASQQFVNLDELMEAVGQRLATLTGAEWGIITSGCSAAETLATCAAIAGGNPENIQRLPDLTGLKDEVIVPAYSRNVYDHAIRMLGVRILTVANTTELEAALGPRTAMVYILACPDDQGPLGLEPIARLAHQQNVPVLVDAAAENLTPGIHLKRGADLVAYSGGKALRGPQAAGLLLGRKDLCKAAWLNSAPHHAFCRSMKVGKEEIMGMLAAVEAWYQRDHEAEWRTWESWLAHVAERVSTLPGVRTGVVEPESLSNNAPRLRISWETCRFGIGGSDVFDLLLAGEPRIILAGARGRFQDCPESASDSWVEIMPWMMEPGQDGIVADRLHGLLSRPPHIAKVQRPTSAPEPVQGSWEVDLRFVHGLDTHLLFFEQDTHKLTGRHIGRTLEGALRGEIYGDQIEFRSSQRYEGARLQFDFKGKVSGNSMEGTVELGEYGPADWTAHRIDYSSNG